MNMTTDRDARQEIITAIEGTGEVTRDEYDIDRILDLAYEFRPGVGFVQTATVGEFWRIVQESEKAPTGADAFSTPA